MVRERRAGNLQLRLNVSSGHFRARLHKKEEDLQPRLVRERLERFDMSVARLESANRECLHVFGYIEIWNACQVFVRRRSRGAAVGGCLRSDKNRSPNGDEAAETEQDKRPSPCRARSGQRINVVQHDTEG